MALRLRTWKVIDYGSVPVDSPTFEYDCPGCGHSAQLPVVGMPIAQFSGGGVVFDPGPHELPKQIKCRKCRRVFVD
jgi:hypothetical protein